MPCRPLLSTSLSWLFLISVPVVSHESASKECKQKLAEAYALNHKLNGSVSEQDLFNLRRKLEEDESQKYKSRNLKQKLIISWAKNNDFQAKYCSYYYSIGTWFSSSIQLSFKYSPYSANPTSTTFMWVLYTSYLTYISYWGYVYIESNVHTILRLCMPSVNAFISYI